jgi:uncharacterized membrane protein
MVSRVFYNPFSIVFMFLLLIILSVIVGILFFSLVSTAFTKIGFTWYDAFLLLILSLFGSHVNIPVTKLKSSEPVVESESVRFMGMVYKLPFKRAVQKQTTLAVNLGGAVIPGLVSLYLLLTFPGAFFYSIAGILLVSVVTYSISKPVKGVGIVTPVLVSPIAAALSAILIVSVFSVPHDLIFVIAYTGGTLGTLIGADIFNLDKIRDIGAPVASIGGAGTFDGIFLAGVIAVLLV